MDKTSDLIGRLQSDQRNEHDLIAFDERYRHLILYWAKLCFNCPEEYAADVYQETVSRLFSQDRTNDFDNQRRFRPWLKHLVKCRTVDLIRRLNRGQSRVEAIRAEEAESGANKPLYIDPELMPDTSQPVPDAEDTEWLANLVGIAMNKAAESSSDANYKAFCLSLLESQDAETIAEKLGISKGSVPVNKMRFREMLLDEIVKLLVEDEPSSGALINQSNANWVKNLRSALDVYMKGRQEFRLTNDGGSTLDDEVERRLAILVANLPEGQPPDLNSQWIRVHGPKDSSWLRVTDGMTIGRRSSSTLAIADSTVSGLHASIHKRAYGWLLRDEGSRHKVYVNDKEVKEHWLVGGDRIQVGATVLIYFTTE